jgi:hypothetical protein
MWSEWSGSYPFDSCFVEDYANCGDTPHGQEETRTRYHSSSVPAGQSCASEIQTRTCNNGWWGPWSGSYAFESCSVSSPGGGGGCKFVVAALSASYCIDFTGTGYTKETIQQLCDQYGASPSYDTQYFESGCSTDGAFGSCIMQPGTITEARTYYYTEASPGSSEQYCVAGGHIWQS